MASRTAGFGRGIRVTSRIVSTEESRWRGVLYALSGEPRTGYSNGLAASAPPHGQGRVSGAPVCWPGGSTQRWDHRMSVQAIRRRNVRLPETLDSTSARANSARFRDRVSGPGAGTRPILRRGHPGPGEQPGRQGRVRAGTSARPPAGSADSGKRDRLVQPGLQLRRPGDDRPGLLRAPAVPGARLSIPRPPAPGSRTSRFSAVILDSFVCSGGSNSSCERIDAARSSGRRRARACRCRTRLQRRGPTGRAGSVWPRSRLACHFWRDGS